jgi:hypothetical protein
MSDPMARLMSNYIPEPNSGCWLWLGPYRSRGYGSMSIGKRRSAPAHRVMLSLVSPNNNPALYACHHCDVACCINPDHLYWGTQTDNMRDAARRGRIKLPLAILDEAQAREIRASTERPITLALRYRISPRHVSAIKAGRSWRRLV